MTCTWLPMKPTTIGESPLTSTNRVAPSGWKRPSRWCGNCWPKREVATMSERLTPERLVELRRIAEAATPGSWQWAGSRDKGDPHAYVYAGDYASEGEPDLWCEIVSECPEADAQHIATFDPTTCLALL